MNGHQPTTMEQVFYTPQNSMKPVDLTIKSIIKVKGVLKCNVNLNKGIWLQ